MSVIGTTHKQPRVFAHDAVSLKELPGCLYRGVAGIDLVTQNGGSGFNLNQVYSALTTGSSGTVVQVRILNTDPDGKIIDLEILNADCQSTNFSEGDVLTVLWAPDQGGVFDTGKDAVDFMQIADLINTGWDYGCPITPAGTRFPIDEPVPASYNPMFSYRQKDLIDLDCTSCKYKALGPGAALYIGYDLKNITVTMESGNVTTFFNVPAGSFLPVAVLTVCAAEAVEGDGAPDPEELKELITCLF